MKTTNETNACPSCNPTVPHEQAKEVLLLETQEITPDARIYRGTCVDCGEYVTPILVPEDWLWEWKDVLEQWKDRHAQRSAELDYATRNWTSEDHAAMKEHLSQQGEGY